MTPEEKAEIDAIRASRPKFDGHEELDLSDQEMAALEEVNQECALEAQAEKDKAQGQQQPEKKLMAFNLGSVVSETTAPQSKFGVISIDPRLSRPLLSKQN